MIPKKIHYCWLSGDEYPPLIEHCIETFKEKMPDYELVLWDRNKFDIGSHPWVKAAFEQKKYAFAADYIRAYALYHEGGIYLDSDVEVLKSFTPLLKYKSVIGFEASTCGIEAAVMAAESGMTWCKGILDSYEKRPFSMDYVRANNLLAPNVVRSALHKIYPNQDWESMPSSAYVTDDDILVCPSTFFSPILYDIEKSYSHGNSNLNKYRRNPETYCIHLFNASWTVRPNRKLQIWDYFKKKFLKKE